MASVFRRRRKVKLASGKTVVRQSQKWHVKYVDSDGIERRVTAYKDKVASQQLAARLEKEAELAREGVVDRYKEHRKRPLVEHLEDFRQALLAKGDTPEYVATVLSRAKRTIKGCKFTFWEDIQPSKVAGYLSELRNNGDGISAQTFNFYLQVMKQFSKWMVQDGRASESQLQHLKGLNVRTDRRHDRRPLEPDEMRRLLETTAAAPKRFGMEGRERTLLYRMAAETGLRRKELQSLKVSSFDFQARTVSVNCSYTKNKRTAVLPLRSDTAADLQSFFTGKLPGVKAFGGTYKRLTNKTANMLKADLADADIPYVDDAERFADFHCLRHTTGSLLAASGVHPKVAQSIMRHSDINLTLSRYTHTLTGQEADAVASLPDLSLPSSEKQVATGTDNRSVEVVQTCPQELTPQLTPELTPTAFSGCYRSAAVGNEPDHIREKDGDGNCLNSGDLDNNSHRLAAVGTGKKGKPTVGFEPTTTGLQNQSSTVELRWHNYLTDKALPSPV
jgi:integrase